MTRHTNTPEAREQQYRAGRARDLALRWLADDHPDEYRDLLHMARCEVNDRRDRLKGLEAELPPRDPNAWDTTASFAGAVRAVMEAKYGSRSA